MTSTEKWQKHTKTYALDGYRLNTKTFNFVIDEVYENYTEPVIFTNHRIEVPPKTGDNDNLFIFGGMMLASLGGLFIALKKKKNNTEEK